MSDFVLNLATSSGSAPVFRPSEKKTGGWKERHKQKKLEKHKFKKLLKNKNPPKSNEQNYKSSTVETFSPPIVEVEQYVPDQDGPNTTAIQADYDNTSDLPAKKPLPKNTNSAANLDKNKNKTSSLFTGFVEQESTQTSQAENQDKFKNLGIMPALSKHLSSKLEIMKPTDIQKIVLFNSLVNNLSPDNPSTKKHYSDTDILIRAETGSGKTLAYMLPIINRLLLSTSETLNNNNSSESQLSKSELPSRNLGTLAIVLTPTRELAKQVYETTLSLINISKASNSADVDEHKDNISAEPVQQVRSHWIVPGLVIGGDKKQSEKARLRKGATILACTPGRLLDHLKTTSSFDVSNLRWLILDECDLLLELGFHETLKEILEILELKKNSLPFANKNSFMLSKHIPKSRINILCSATLKDNVKKLADISLNNPLVLSSSKNSLSMVSDPNINDSDTDESSSDDENLSDSSTSQKKIKAEPKPKPAKKVEIAPLEFNVPTQLLQEFLVTPPKLRLVALTNLMKFFIKSNNEAKIIVFLSCKDEVDFFYSLFSNTDKKKITGQFTEKSDREIDEKANQNDSDNDIDDISKDLNGSDPESRSSNTKKRDSTDSYGKDTRSQNFNRNDYSNKNGKYNNRKDYNDKSDHSVYNKSYVLENTSIFRLHGSLPQFLRSETISKFTSLENNNRNTGFSGENSRGAKILFCTDVAARGLDMPEISHIIQYDPPTDIASYVHRVGRTARIGGYGRAVLMLLPSETEYLNLLDSNKLTLSRISYDNNIGNETKNTKNGVESFVSAFYREGGNNLNKSITNSVELEQLLKICCLINKQKTAQWMDLATDTQMKFENYVLSHESRSQLAQTAFMSSVRAYATHTPSEKHIFHIKNLHLGHFAKAFGLRQAPKTINVGNKVVSTSKSQKTKNDTSKLPIKKRIKPSEMSEFSIGAPTSMLGPRTKKFKR
ncbi:hypothetical protein BB561_004186 [Smittium simulii]|uniref:ATP-dependent RNA helicase n=1 Tax=Smittium simulii TaxID=133385 RepID=A0A2T9YHL5_9FUNG|nr:hypothetical protein BB561_004186 [Smittium simulii]